MVDQNMILKQFHGAVCPVGMAWTFLQGTPCSQVLQMFHIPILTSCLVMCFQEAAGGRGDPLQHGKQWPSITQFPSQPHLPLQAKEL